MDKKVKVVFYFPWKEVSGGPIYLSNLANQLAELDGYEVYYTDYKNGLSDTLLNNKKIKKIEYQEKNFSFPIKEPVILITPVYWAHVVPSLHPKSKIVFFNWHYCCIPVLRTDSQWHKKTVKKFLELVQETDSCFFGDLTHLLGQNTKTIKFKPRYVPITLSPKKNINTKAELIKKGEINIGALSRLCPDKIWAYLDLLKNLKNCNIPTKINVHIIGDGTHRDSFEKKCKKLNLPKNIHLIMYGRLVGEKLNKTMQDHFDVLFAMGTCLLEGAAIKIPSVIIPHNTSVFHKDEYVYLQNTKEYCLGWWDVQMKYLNLNTMPLKEVLDDIYKHNKKKLLGEEAYKYYCKNHQKNINLFLDVVNASQLTYEKLTTIYDLHKKLSPDPDVSFLERIFSVKNKNNKKIFRIFGIKIKIDRKYFRKKRNSNLKE